MQAQTTKLDACEITALDVIGRERVSKSEQSTTTRRTAWSMPPTLIDMERAGLATNSGDQCPGPAG